MLSVISSWLARLAARLREPSLPGAEHFTVRGIPVVVQNTRPDIATSDAIARLDEALGLIETYQPWRLAHLKRDVVRILVARYACRGAYFPGERTVLTELTFLARRDITAAPVASSIAHEGMHARMDRRGATQTPDSLARQERICRRAELDFGRALPPELGTPVVERALASLALEDQDVAPEIDWQLASQRIASADRTAAQRREK